MHVAHDHDADILCREKASYRTDVADSKLDRRHDSIQLQVKVA